MIDLDTAKRAVKFAANEHQSWSQVDLDERRRRVSDCLDLLCAHRELISRLLMWEIGKPLKLAQDDVDRCISGVEWYVDQIEPMLAGRTPSQRIMDASQHSIATSMGSSPRFLQAIEDRLPSALLLLEITPVDGVRSPLAVDLKSRSSTYPQRWNLKNARHAICYSSTANPSCLMSIRSISRPADRFISTKPSLETEQMGSPFQSNHWR